jgi:hypothetical protein
MLAYLENSKVVLMCSTEDHGMAWNLEAKNYKASELYRNSLLDEDTVCSPLSWHKDVYVLDPLDTEGSLKMQLLDVKGLTTGQIGQECFLLRGFSLTSSTSDKCVAVVKDHICSASPAAFDDCEAYESTVSIIKYVYSDLRLPDQQEQEEDSSETDAPSTSHTRYY